MRLSSLIIGLSLILAVIAACGNGETDKDKTEPVAQQTGSSELIKQGDVLFDNGQQSEALEVYRSAADTALAENDNAGLTEAYSQMARCYLSMDNKEEGRTWLAKAEAIAKDTEPPGWTRFLSVKGRYIWKDAAGKQDEAAPVVDEAAKIFSDLYDYALENKLYGRAADAANMMSIVGNPQNRVEWGLKGIKAAEIGDQDNLLAILWNNLGWNYSDLGRYGESLEALKKARRYHYKRGLEKPMLISDWSVAYAFRMAGQPDSSMNWCMRIAPWAKDIYDEEPSEENAEWLGLCYRELAESSLAKGEEKRAVAGFRSAKMYFDKANLKERDEKSYNELLEKLENLEANSKK